MRDPRTGVLVVSIASTSGWRAAAGELARSLARAGASVETVTADPGPSVRTFALTDFVQARGARDACLRGIAEHDPAAIIYCSITAALLWPRPGAVWLDSIAAENRPGRHGIWQRTVERRRLQQAPVVLAMSRRSLTPLNGWIGVRHPIVMPSPVQRSGSDAVPAGRRDIAAVTYAGNPEKKRLAFVLEAWQRARRADERLVVAGLEAPRVGAVPAGVDVAGRLEPDDYRALLRRARVFVAAPLREDYGIAPLEALADGCRLVSTPAPGPYAALEIARQLDPRLVDEDLAGALRIALDHPRPGYTQRAQELLEPFGRAAIDRTIAEDVLPRLLAGLPRS
ncbi:MAG: glycosyltransferase [Solirubrobacteraceae bacterium]